MASGLINKTCTSSLDLIEITEDACRRLPKWYNDDLEVATCLLRALRQLNVGNIPNSLLDCARGEICDAVQLVGKIPSIKCSASDPSRCGLSLILNWGGGMSVWKKKKLVEWIDRVGYKLSNLIGQSGPKIILTTMSLAQHCA
ncbi:hypothetical protein K435DRAFT_790902 [Dendrothele bispora CBS 962.96]|uniref:Uncharacterized protein n=1 Tax=Dendrothele bispora (strain CBS 962.96) TaxID=1314807 RepID=A0A4S8MNV8_DENBC|nr:hypothetical protein K435DRAFT_790902 [Dendrothele bispora CBS 962.96]